MKVFLDTSVLVAAMVESHPHHERSLGALQDARDAGAKWAVAAHSLAELYAVLTSLPVKPRITPALARRFIRENLEDSAEIIGLTSTEYLATLSRLSDSGILGGSVYDALLARAAEKAGATRILTLNPEDFRRVWPSVARIVALP